MDQYKELYDLAREAAAQTEARFDAIDTKASNYLSVFTVLLGAAGFLVKWVADRFLPPHGVLAYLLVFLAFVTTGLVGWTWLRLLQVLKVHKIQVLPLNEETVEFYTAHRLVDIYFGVARVLSEVWVANQDVNERKLEKLTSAYRAMILTLTLVAVFSILYAVHVWVGGNGAK